MVKSQTANLTPNLSFGHNLCFKCPNGSCEPILDIYVSNDIKKVSIHWVLTPIIALWIFESPPRLQTPKMEVPLGMWRFIPSHFPSLLGFLLAPNLASPCLGHEPKARVATIFIYNLEKYFDTIMHIVSKYHPPYTNTRLIFQKFDTRPTLRSKFFKVYQNFVITSPLFIFFTQSFFTM